MKGRAQQSHYIAGKIQTSAYSPYIRDVLQRTTTVYLGVQSVWSCVPGIFPASRINEFVGQMEILDIIFCFGSFKHFVGNRLLICPPTYILISPYVNKGKNWILCYVVVSYIFSFYGNISTTMTKKFVFNFPLSFSSFIAARNSSCRLRHCWFNNLCLIISLIVSGQQLEMKWVCILFASYNEVLLVLCMYRVDSDEFYLCSTNRVLEILIKFTLFISNFILGERRKDV